MILLTGVNGFVGHHLAKACFDQGLEAIGSGFGELSTDSPLASLLKKYLPIDLTSSDAVNETLDFKNIDTVIHLAGLAAVGPSYDQPNKYISSNTSMLVNLVEKAIAQERKPRFVVISSGTVYDPNQPKPIKEDSKLLPSSPYAVSKISAELFCDYYRQRGLDMILVRPFNHIGPGQGPGFILPDLSTQAKNYSKTGKFKVGNLSTKRDYTDVRDVVRSYILLAKTTDLSHTVYNVCSGKSFSGEYILDEICKNFSIKNPEIEIDESKIRPSEIMNIYGDNSRLVEDTGWNPQIPIEQSVADFVKSF